MTALLILQLLEHNLLSPLRPVLQTNSSTRRDESTNSLWRGIKMHNGTKIFEISEKSSLETYFRY